MRSLTLPKAFSKQRQIRSWKKHHLYRGGKQTSLVTPGRAPVFRASTNTQELSEFLDRLRDRT